MVQLSSNPAPHSPYRNNELSGSVRIERGGVEIRRCRDCSMAKTPETTRVAHVAPMRPHDRSPERALFDALAKPEGHRNHSAIMAKLWSSDRAQTACRRLQSLRPTARGHRSGCARGR